MSWAPSRRPSSSLIWGSTRRNDGRVIRVVIPYLSEERRKELIKLTHKKVEEGRVAVRACRHEACRPWSSMQKDKEISEDDLKRGKERLQKMTDAYIAKVEQVGALQGRGDSGSLGVTRVRQRSCL